MTDTFHIIAGVDGSPAGHAALLFAAQEAGRCGGTVTAVAVWHWDGAAITPLIAATPNDAKNRAAGILAREIRTVREQVGTDVPIQRRLVQGNPTEALVDAARDAHMLVLGSHGHGRMHQAVLGSVSERCVREATCPVVVIPVGAHAVAVNT